MATREKDLIEKEAANNRFKVEADTTTQKINVEADAATQTIKAEAEAKSISLVERAKADAERTRMETYAGVQPAVLLALAAQEFAGKVNTIENLTITPDMLAGLMSQVGTFLGKETV